MDDKKDDLAVKASAAASPATIMSEYHQAMIDAQLAAQQRMAAQQHAHMMSQYNAASSSLAKPINKDVMVFEVEAVENGFVVRHAAGTLSNHAVTRKSIASSIEELRDIVSTNLMINRMEN